MFGKIIPMPYKIAAVAAVTVAVFGFGFHKGSVNQIRKQEAVRVALQEDLFDLASQISVKNAEILELQKQQQELAHELETQALEAEGSDAPGISTTGGLQRLERRWGESN